MKATDSTDLMIGDWVIVHARTDRTAKIEAIDLHGVKTSIGGPWMFDEIDPIPLTPEILEKNGFKIAKGPAYKELPPGYVWGNKLADVSIMIYNKPVEGVNILTRIETSCKDKCGVNKIHSCDIESVHELQHALRLCGIEKEIEL